MREILGNHGGVRDWRAYGLDPRNSLKRFRTRPVKRCFQRLAGLFLSPNWPCKRRVLHEAGASRKQKQAVQKKIRNIRKNAEKRKKGEEHSKARKQGA